MSLKDLSPEQRREIARSGNIARWSRDPAGVAQLVDRLVRRAAALSDEQRGVVRAAIDAPAGAE